MQKQTVAVTVSNEHVRALIAELTDPGSAPDMEAHTDYNRYFDYERGPGGSSPDSGDRSSYNDGGDQFGRNSTYSERYSAHNDSRQSGGRR